MGIVNTQAIVLRYTDFKEADRVLTLFSPNLGKLQAVARGCRRPKSRLLAATQLFCYGDYILYKGTDMYIVSQADVKQSFYEIRNDVEKFAYATYLLNLTEEAVNAGEGNPRLFYLLLHMLNYLCYSDMNPDDMIHIFEIKLIDLLGYRPLLSNCIKCGGELKRKVQFDFDEGGVVCSNCYKLNNNGYTIQMGTLRTMEKVLDMDVRRMNVLKFPQEVRKELDEVLHRYLEIRLDKRLKSRFFIEQMKQKKE